MLRRGKRGSVSGAMLAGIGLLSFCFAGCATDNEKALARMSAQQRTYLSANVDALRYGMSERRVTEILGPPSRGMGTPRICYPAPGERHKSEVCVRFELFRAHTVEWVTPGENGFEYRLDLKERDAP